MVENQQLKDWVQEKLLLEGLVSISKPYGIPSTAIVEMYKIASGKKVGHGGTLDPLAEGAMLLGIGAGTKLLSKYLESEKRYRTIILFGANSQSGDLELPLEYSAESVLLKKERIEEILDELKQGFTQELPPLSAAKQQGKTFYDLVREGKQPEKRTVETRLLEAKLLAVDVLPRDGLTKVLKYVEVQLVDSFALFHKISEDIGYRRKYPYLLEKWRNSLNDSLVRLQPLDQQTFGSIELEVLVPKGTYIRSLATDIASRLGTEGVLLSLERLNAGNR